MEVHHHTHHPKKWKEYFWEFFMLFLAVFCGFLAEIQVEHYVEHQREQKFVSQLMLDLQSDESNLIDYINGQKYRGICIDSIFIMIKNKEVDTKRNDIYFYARTLSRYGNYVPTDGTIAQLKFGGNLRLIKNNKIVTDVLDYDNYTKVLTQFIVTSFQDIINYRLICEEIFDGTAFYDMISENNAIIRLDNCPPIQSTSPKILNSFIMRLQHMKSSNGRYISLANTLLEKERALKKAIKKEYHLE